MEKQATFLDVYNGNYSQLVDAGNTKAMAALNSLYDEWDKDKAKDPKLAEKAQQIVDNANIKYSQANNPAREYMDSAAPVRTEWGFTDEGLAKALGPTLGGKDLYSYEPGEGWITTPPNVSGSEYAGKQKRAIEKAYGEGSYGPAMDYLRDRATEESRSNVASGLNQEGDWYEGDWSPSKMIFGGARRLGGMASGFFTPRMNESVQRAETPYNVKDIALDLGENALMAAPLGTAGTATGRVAMKLAPEAIKGTAGKLAGKAVRNIGFNSIVPVATEGLDAAAYDDPENPRSEFNWGDVATGTAVNIGTPLMIRGTAAGLQAKMAGMGPKTRDYTRALSHVGENPYTQGVPEARAKWADVKTMIPVNEQGASQIVKPYTFAYSREKFPTQGVSVNDIKNARAGNLLGTNETPYENFIRAGYMEKLYKAIDDGKASELYSKGAPAKQKPTSIFTHTIVPNDKPYLSEHSVALPAEYDDGFSTEKVKFSKKPLTGNFEEHYLGNARENPQVINIEKLAAESPDIAKLLADPDPDKQRAGILARSADDTPGIAKLFADPETRADAIAAIAFDPNLRFVPGLQGANRAKANAYANEMLPAWYVNKIGKSDNAARASSIVPGFSQLQELGQQEHDERMKELKAKKSADKDPTADMTEAEVKVFRANPKGYKLWKAGNRHGNGLTAEQQAALEQDSINQLRGE